MVHKNQICVQRILDIVFRVVKVIKIYIFSHMYCTPLSYLVKCLEFLQVYEYYVNVLFCVCFLIDNYDK